MPTLTITIIQATLQWEDKTANLRYFGDRIDSLSEKTEIVILPEMFSTGFSMRPAALAEEMDGPTVTWMKRTAARKKIILTGSLIIREAGRYFNRLLWVLPDGTFGCYDKRHLFAYAGEDEHYTPGHKRLIASVKGWKINLLICYDLRFPVWSRQQLAHDPETPDKPLTLPQETVRPAPLSPGQPEFDILIYVANWPERRSQAWKTLLPARAIENQAYVIGVNRVGADGNGIPHSGDSMIVDPTGNICWQQTGQEAVYTCTFDKKDLEETRTRFPFWRDADHFSIEL